MITRMQDGAWVASSGGVWLPGSYATAKAARLAFRVDPDALESAWEAMRGPDGIVTGIFTEAAIRCTDAYVPRNVKTGDHAPLKLAFRDDSARGSTMRVFTREFAALADLKAFAASLDISKMRAKAA